MKAIIVDDEPKAIALLKSYLAHFSLIELVATFRNGLKAFEYLHHHPVDLVFLDINMPHISGISLARMLNKETKTIFTTAYSDYAVESYDLAAVDYLLKPISLDRFILAMRKVLDETTATVPDTPSTIWLKSGSKVYRVQVSDIGYLKKEGNYLTYFTSARAVVARESIAFALAKLPAYFCRVHKSYIVNIHCVTALEKDSVSVFDQAIPVSNTYAGSLRNALPDLPP